MNCQRDLVLGDVKMSNQRQLLIQFAEVGGLEEDGNEEVLHSYHARAGVLCLLTEAETTSAIKVRHSN